MRTWQTVMPKARFLCIVYFFSEAMSLKVVLTLPWHTSAYKKYLYYFIYLQSTPFIIHTITDHSLGQNYLFGPFIHSLLLRILTSFQLIWILSNPSSCTLRITNCATICPGSVLRLTTEPAYPVFLNAKKCWKWNKSTCFYVMVALFITFSASCHKKSNISKKFKI